MRAWMNGELLADPAVPAIGISDHGLTVGDGVFESIKVLDNVPFAMTRHVERLVRSAAGLGLPPVDRGAVRRGVAAVLEAQDLPLGRLRLTYTAGPGPFGSGRGEGPPTLLVVADTMVAFPTTTSIATVPWPRNERGALSGLKTTSYAENVIALARAREQGATEAIFANTRGHLCEGTGSNIFYVVDGELRTPTLESGCLAGVTRSLLLEWYGAREIDEPIDILHAASEIFLVSTTRDVQGVHTCDRRSLPAPGPVTEAAAAAWLAGEAQDLDP
jgi:branched-chain amino acid aminotransferase